MHRRRFLACAALAGVAGCLGSEPRNRTAGDGEHDEGTDWEPASTAADTEERTGDDKGATTPKEGTEAFENGEDWQADRAQVAAEQSRAGRAIEFELRTAPPRKCGRTCRKLRGELANTGSEEARDVAVRTTLRSGDTVLRERRDAVGTLPAGATYRASERVELGPLEALRVKRNGTITIEQVVTSATRREVFRRRIEL